MSNLTKCRWGILSTAGIARKNWRAIAKSENGSLSAVASRSLDAADQFIDECQALCPQTNRPLAVQGYAELLKRNDVDAVYIPLPTGIRKEWILAAVENGKHVLAEKPTALSASDLQEILEACRKHQVQFMDGVMFMHSARLPLIRDQLNDGESVGNIRRIACQFSFLGGDEFSKSNIRVDSELEPFGCLGDLGWYCIRFLLWANDWQMPLTATGRCIQSAAGSKSKGPVPVDFSAEMTFPNGSTAGFYCSFTTGNQQWVHISGTRGNLVVQDFVLPFFGDEVAFEVAQPEYQIRGCDFHMHARNRRVSVQEYDSGFAPSQEINMINAFGKIVLSKKLDPSWGEISLATQRVMDQLFNGAGD